MKHQATPAAQAIAALIGNVDRPTRHYPFSRDVGHLPGRHGLIAGVAMLHGMTHRGEAYFTKGYQEFGPVFRDMVGPDPIVCVADAELNWQIAVNKQRIWSSALPWAYLLGGTNRRAPMVDGPLALDGPYHHDVRELMRPAFGAAALDGYIATAIDVYNQRFSQWQQRGQVPFKAEVRRLMADAAAKVFLGIDDPKEGAMLDEATADAWLAPQAVFKRTRWSRSWQRAMRGYDTLWNALLPRVAAKRAGDGKDLFSWMARTTGHEQTSATGQPWLDDAALVRVLISSMMAAFDTTSSGIANMAWLLAKYPQWQDKMRAELPEGPLTADVLRQLVVHDLVWKESLRLLPVAGQLNRQALVDTELGGHRIAAGTLVIALTGTTMWDSRYWSNPKAFDPLRFGPERAEHKNHQGAYLPFGAGNHVCLGAQLATLEALAFFATLLRRHKLTLVDGADPGHGYVPFGVVLGSLPMRIEAL
jgi:cytochrome P450